MHGIHSSVFCLPLLLNRDSVELPLAVPHSLEQLHTFPISDRDGRTGCSRLCCGLLSTFGCGFGCRFRVRTKEVRMRSDKEVSRLHSFMQYDADPFFFMN